MARPVAGPVVRSVAHKSWLEEIVTHRSGAPRSRGTAGQQPAAKLGIPTYVLAVYWLHVAHVQTCCRYSTQLLYVNAAGRASC